MYKTVNGKYIHGKWDYFDNDKELFVEIRIRDAARLLIEYPNQLPENIKELIKDQEL